MFTLRNPTKTEDLLSYVVQSLPCPKCKDVLSIEIASHKLYEYNQGGYAQNVLEGYPPDVRERFITGICGPCWKTVFAEE